MGFGGGGVCFLMFLCMDQLSTDSTDYLNFPGIQGITNFLFLSTGIQKVSKQPYKNEHSVFSRKFLLEYQAFKELSQKVFPSNVFRQAPQIPVAENLNYLSFGYLPDL